MAVAGILIRLILAVVGIAVLMEVSGEARMASNVADFSSVGESGGGKQWVGESKRLSYRKPPAPVRNPNFSPAPSSPPSSPPRSAYTKPPAPPCSPPPPLLSDQPNTYRGQQLISP